MTSNEINVVEAFIEAINRRDPGELSGLMTEDHAFVDSGGRIQSGRENMTAGWKDYFRMFPDYEIRVERLLGDQNPGSGVRFGFRNLQRQAWTCCGKQNHNASGMEGFGRERQDQALAGLCGLDERLQNNRGRQRGWLIGSPAGLPSWLSSTLGAPRQLRSVINWSKQHGRPARS